MAYAVSQDFKTAIKDQTSAKSCLILFDDLFFSTSDFTDSGVVFNQYFNTSEDLTFGDCPSDTLSFSVVANGTLKGYPFGRALTYLGVQTKRASETFTELAYVRIPYGSSYVIYSARQAGLYMQVGAFGEETLIDEGRYTGLIAVNPFGVYAIGATKSVFVDGGVATPYYPTRFMVEKCKNGLSVYFYKSGSNFYGMSWDGRYRNEYEYVPMGVYNITKPMSTVGKIVNIQDAYDNMTLFDINAGKFISSIPYATTLGDILTKLCQYVNVGLVSSTFPHSTDRYKLSNLDPSCTLRDIVGWIAQKAQRVAHFNRNGLLELVWVNPYSEGSSEVLMPQDVGMDGFTIAEYKTPRVTGVVLHVDDENTISYGIERCIYEVEKNPFIKSISNSDLKNYMNIPTYSPLECDVLECDPSVNLGEVVRLKPNGDETQVLVDVYGNAYAAPFSLRNSSTGNALVNGDNGKMLARLEALAVKAPHYDIPLMNRTVYYIGAIRAEYSATGGIIREVSADTTFTPQEGV